MLKKFFIIAVLLLGISTAAKAQIYIGAGPEYLVATGDLQDVNNNTMGLNILLESRATCNFWWGVRADYFELEPSPDIEPGKDYFREMIYFSPQLRYNFFYDDCYSNKIIPYIQAAFTASSIEGSDSLSRLGLGMQAGLGTAIGFEMGRTCAVADLNAVYSAPNFIYKDEKRTTLNSINISFTLSIRL